MRCCHDCKYCSRLFDYEEESSLLYCENAFTKELDHPIGFLSSDWEGCEYFEKRFEPRTQDPNARSVGEP
jgi:hypothetical protein